MYITQFNAIRNTTYIRLFMIKSLNFSTTVFFFWPHSERLQGFRLHLALYLVVFKETLIVKVLLTWESTKVRMNHCSPGAGGPSDLHISSDSPLRGALVVREGSGNDAGRVATNPSRLVQPLTQPRAFGYHKMMPCYHLCEGLPNSSQLA